LPGEVRDIAGDGSLCANIGLWLDRYLHRNPPGDQKEWDITEGTKKREHILRMAERLEVKELVKAVNRRYSSLLKWYKQRGFEVRSFEAVPEWRFVVGLGAAHVLETGISLHRIFGIPIIPGSGLKGAARAYALRELAEKMGVPILSPAQAKGKQTPLKCFLEYLLEPDGSRRSEILSSLRKHQDLPEDARIKSLPPERVERETSAFRRIFGTRGWAGEVVFLDAVPVGGVRFSLDIMNPHYPNYYSSQGKGSPPADYESPRPVFFLTVEGTRYRFALAARRGEAGGLLPIAEGWLKGALQKLGVGAKTSANYGYWEVT